MFDTIKYFAEEWKQVLYEKLQCLKVPRKKKEEAAAYLRSQLKKEKMDGITYYDKIKESVDAAGKDWIDHFEDKVNKSFEAQHARILAPYTFHFYDGMYIRNILREGGFGERELGIDNLDFIYDELIQMAVK